MSTAVRCVLSLCVLLMLGCYGPDDRILARIRDAGGEVTLASSGGIGRQQIYVAIKGEKGDTELKSVAPHLKDLRQVTGLHMQDSRVTDDGLMHLAEVNNIGLIVLRNTAVTDRGLQYLRHMDKLWYLDLTGMRVTDEGIASLKQALPKLEIEKLMPHRRRPKKIFGQLVDN